MKRSERLRDGSDGDVLADAQQDVVQGSMWTLLATVVAVPVTFLSSLVVVRLLGSVEYGRLATFSTAMVVLGAVSGMGFNEATIQWTAAARVRGDTEQVAGILRRCSGFHLLIDGPVLGLLVGVLLRDAPLPLTATAVLAAIVTKAAGSSMVVLTAYMANALAARIAFVATLVAQASFVGAAFAGRSAEWAWVGQLVGATVLPVACWMWLTPALRRALLRPIFPNRLPSGFARFAISSWFAGCLALLVYGRTEVFVLTWYHAAGVVGVYALASTLAGQLTIVMDSLMGPISPAATTVVAHDRRRAAASLERAIRVSGVLAALTLAILLGPLAQLVGALYGDQFAQAKWAIVALGLVSCALSAAHPIDAFGFALHMADKVLIANLVAVVIDLGLAFSLIPWNALAGAVIANIAAQCSALLLLTWLVLRRIGLGWSVLRHALRPGAAGAAALAVGLSTSLIGLPAWPTAVLTTVASVASLSAVAHLTRALELPADDAGMIDRHLPWPLKRSFRIASAIFALRPRRKSPSTPP